MSTQESHTVVVERMLAHTPEKVWRALTESSLLAQWLMDNDFAARPGHTFQFRREPVANWDGVIQCEVLVVEPSKKLQYTWSAMGLDTTVQFTLDATDGGTHLRMEQSGFRSDNDAAFQGATWGWQKFLGTLETVLHGDAR